MPIKEVIIMKCPKCNGFMFLERFYDFFLRFDAWKCINCGAIMDNTIMTNKAGTKSSPFPLKPLPVAIKSCNK